MGAAGRLPFPCPPPPPVGSLWHQFSFEANRRIDCCFRETAKRPAGESSFRI